MDQVIELARSVDESMESLFVTDASHPKADPCTLALGYTNDTLTKLQNLEQQLSSLEQKHMTQSFMDYVQHHVEEVLFGFQQQTETLVALCASYGYVSRQQEVLLLQQQAALKSAQGEQDIQQDYSFSPEHSLAYGDAAEEVEQLAHESSIYVLSPSTPIREQSHYDEQAAFLDSPLVPALSSIRGGFCAKLSYTPTLATAIDNHINPKTPMSKQPLFSREELHSVEHSRKETRREVTEEEEEEVEEMMRFSTPTNVQHHGIFHNDALDDSPDLKDLGLSNLALGIVGSSESVHSYERNAADSSFMEISDSP